MKRFRLSVDFRGRDKSWCKSFEVSAESAEDAISRQYMALHETMKCAFRIWACVELVDNPKLEEKNDPELF